MKRDGRKRMTISPLAKTIDLGRRIPNRLILL